MLGRTSSVTPIFVMGHARSGSTLLQRLLNSVPGVRIYGEHGGNLYQVAVAYRGLCKDLPKHHSADLTEAEAEQLLSDPNCWSAKVAAYQTSTIRELTVRYIEALGNPFSRTDVRWGFKEVRFGVDSNVTNMLLELLPDCQIVFTVRACPFEYCDSVKSQGWLRDVARTTHSWNQQRNHFRVAAKHERVRLLNFGAGEDEYNALFDWLRLPWTAAQSDILNGERVGASLQKNLLTPEEIETIQRVSKVEPPVGYDPTTSPLPRAHSTN